MLNQLSCTPPPPPKSNANIQVNLQSSYIIVVIAKTEAVSTNVQWLSICTFSHQVSAEVVKPFSVHIKSPCMSVTINRNCQQMMEFLTIQLCNLKQMHQDVNVTVQTSSATSQLT